MLDNPDEHLSIQQAIAYLTEITESEKSPLDKIAMEGQSLSMDRIKKRALHKVKVILSTIHSYLKRAYRQEKKNISDPSIQQSLQAIMILVQEAVDKMDRNFPEMTKILGKKRISTLPQYKKLQEFYLSKILIKPMEQQELEKVWPSNIENIEMDGVAIRDIRQVKQDKDYELFYMRKLDNTPYFGKDLIRHLKMITDFEGILQVIDGDPFVAFNVIQDKNCQICAAQVKEYLISHFPEFFREMLKNKHFSFTQIINKALIALFLSANPSNVIYETIAFHCLKYFQDFLLYFKEVFMAVEYTSALSSENPHEFLAIEIQMIHAICFAIYTHREEKTSMLHHLENLLGKSDALSKTAIGLIGSLQEKYTQLRQILDRYPNGPLFKMIDVINEGKISFHPIQYNNLPSYLYTIHHDKKEISALRIPSPSLQTTLEEAYIIDEFKGLLRFFIDKNWKIVVCNLQKRLSQKEMARAKAIEELQREGEFISTLSVFTLSTNLGFVLHTASRGVKETICAEMRQVLQNPEKYGLYFPQGLWQKLESGFLKKLSPTIMELFFSKKKNCNEQDCLDFVEILYLFLVLKILDVENPNFFSYICKDGVDYSTCLHFTLYLAITILQGPFTATKEKEEYLKWQLFTPALMVRERAIQSQCFATSCSSLQLIAKAVEKNRAEIIKELNTLYGKDFFATLQIET